MYVSFPITHFTTGKTTLIS